MRAYLSLLALITLVSFLVIGVFETIPSFTFEAYAKPKNSPAPAKASANQPETPKTEPKETKLLPAEEAALAYKQGDFVKAREIWQKMADSGDAYAMNNLGILYDRGLGVTVDLGRALFWFAKSANEGNPQGMSNYGWMLDQGRGIAPNPVDAARWYDKSARMGQAEAQYNLGLMYERGRGVPKDLSSAAAWYSQAASQQQTEALARLGHFYRVGSGVEVDPAKACLLLYAATMNGSEEAIKELAEMAPKDASSKGIALFGQRMDQTNRKIMREVLRKSQVPEVRVKDEFICDIYDVRKAVPGANQMTVCYGTPPESPLGFLKIDYAAPSQEYALQIQRMVEGRFGEVSAKESADSSLWNMGTCVIATQYVPESKQMSLMYMVPRVYHQTKARN
ncbi:MAG: sel1 repeat family protein [Desulfovibrionaceae bacterium]|nr:sel1 repeat family protein [Desulfovibrionaceae bacterium]